MPVLDLTDIRYLRGVAGGAKTDQAPSAVARRFSKEYDIGRLVSGRIVFAPEDAGRAADILTRAAIPIEPPTELFTRADAALSGLPSEKSGSRGPYQGAVLVRALNDGVMVGGDPIQPRPGFSHLIDLEVAARAQCDIVLWVENLETFRRLDRYLWIAKDQGSIFALYRGDTNLNMATSTLALAGRPRVWLFVDYDPAGIVIADAASVRASVERVIVPSLDWLEGRLAENGRADLYHIQKRFWQAASAARHPDLQAIWERVARHQKGLPQEASEMLSTAT
ncbi:MAG: hypothetical protein C0434_04205 [Xanthomonadaceae bacterium]|nr:hypothetical protein [Xanthomonadaceae bacterium]